VSRDVEHIVLAVDAGERRSIAERLLAAGLVDSREPTNETGWVDGLTAVYLLRFNEPRYWEAD
jgi:hypothetical protein